MLPTYRLIARNSAAMAAWFVETLQKLHMTSGSLLGSATNDSTGLVQKELPVTQGRFRIRVARHDDGLNVGAAPAFARHPVSKLGQAFHPWRIVPVVPLRGSVTMNNLPGLCPSLARLFLELVTFGTKLVDPIEHPLQELLR
jgi:hypothetical protein